MTATYTARVAAAARQPFLLVEIAVPTCVIAGMGTAPCTAADPGNNLRCYRSRPTCVDVTNYDRNGGGTFQDTKLTWRFVSESVGTLPADFAASSNEYLPLVLKSTHVATEIDPDEGMSRPESFKVMMDDLGGEDLADNALNVCPAFDQGSLTPNTTRAGNFWPRWLEIHDNYRNSSMTVKRCFADQSFLESDAETIWKGRVDAVRFKSKGQVEIEARDLFVDLDKELPPAISKDNTTQAAYSRTATAIVMADGAEFTDPAGVTGNVVIEVPTIHGRLEKCKVSSISTNTLTVSRGDFGTFAEPWPLNAKVKEVLHYGTDGGTNGEAPLDIVNDLLNRAGVPAGDVDSTNFTAEALWIGPAKLSRTVREPTPVNEMCFEILELFNGNIFVTEDQKIKVHVNSPPAIGETVGTVVDATNILAGTGRVQSGDRQRLTHVTVKYDLEDAEGKARDGKEVDIQIAVNNTQFAADYYGNGEEDKFSKTIESPWIQGWDDGQGQITAVRWAQRHRFAARHFTYSAELRDDSQQLGELVDLTTSLIQDEHGADRTLRCVVIGKKWTGMHGFNFTLLETGFGGGAGSDTVNSRDQRYAFIGPSAMTSVYDSESAANQAAYWFIADSNDQLGAANDAGKHLT